MTTVGLIGSGHIGMAVARLAIAAGHQVVLSNSRGPETLADAVAQLGPRASAATSGEAAAAGDIIVVTVPVKAFPDLPVASLAGKTVIDTCNYGPERDGPIPELDDRSLTSSELLARSIRRLGVEHVDLLQLHGQDYNTPVEETLSTLDQLVRAGKVRYIGGSNFVGWHMMKSLAVADRYGYPRHVAHQVYYSLLNRDYEWELMSLGEVEGIGATVWSPLGWGKLTGKIRRGQPAKPGTRAHDIAGTGPHYDEERLFRIVDALDVVAKETDKTVPQVALSWLLTRKTVSSIIIGARDEKQLIENIGATGWTLDAAQITRLDAASDAPAAYPVWHQRGFPMLNEPR